MELTAAGWRPIRRRVCPAVAVGGKEWDRLTLAGEVTTQPAAVMQENGR